MIFILNYTDFYKKCTTYVYSSLSKLLCNFSIYRPEITNAVFYTFYHRLLNLLPVSEMVKNILTIIVKISQKMKIVAQKTLFYKISMISSIWSSSILHLKSGCFCFTCSNLIICVFYPSLMLKLVRTYSKLTCIWYCTAAIFIQMITLSM